MTLENIITGNTFKKICNDFIDDEKQSIDISKKPKIIFLKTDWVEQFKIKILPKIDYQFKLITHNSDFSVPHLTCNRGTVPQKHDDLLNNEKLLRWYGMNCDIEHPKLQPIPIGIANEKWPHGNKEELIEVTNTEIPKTGLCYSNFEITTNYAHRPEIFNIIQLKSFIDIDTQKFNYKQYLTKLKSYKYVISPPGNSVDCHRIWEAIYLGVIPIVEKHLALQYFHDLPILFVNSFNELTSDLLEEKYETIKTYSKDKAMLSHYINLIAQK